MEFVINQAGEVDLPKVLEYIAKQFGKDLKQAVDARDELAKRQGALSAVDAALTLRTDADAYYATTKASCDKMVADTKETADLIKSKKKELDEREKALDAKEKVHLATVADHGKSIKARDESLTADRSVLNEKAAALEVAARNLAAAEANLNARVKAFQDKVAQITA
jgi:DNA repair exonuclease SbcCD ATPase subunit